MKRSSDFTNSSLSGESKDSFYCLVGLLHQASIGPGLWPRALDTLSSVLGDVPVFFYAVEPGNSADDFCYLSGLPPAFCRTGRDGRWKTGGWLQKALDLEMPLLTLISTSALMSADEFKETNFHRNLLKPNGFEGALFAVLHRQGNKICVVGTLRPKGAAAIASKKQAVFQKLLPHFQATAPLYGMKTIEAVAEMVRATVQPLPFGFFIVDRRAAILFQNAMGEKILASEKGGDANASNQLLLGSRHEQAIFSRLLKETLADGESSSLPAPRAMNLSEGNGQAALSLLILPAPPGAGNSDKVKNWATVIVSVNGKRPDPPADILRQLFPFTQVEARIVKALLRHDTLKAVAVENSITVNTLKTHLKNIYGKTGTSRQTELVRLLMALPAVIYVHDGG